MKMIFDKYKIEHDGRQFILSKLPEKKKKEDGPDTWREVGYYPRIDMLLRGIINQGLSKDAVNTVKEIKQMIDEAVDFLEQNHD